MKADDNVSGQSTIFISWSECEFGSPPGVRVRGSAKRETVGTRGILREDGRDRMLELGRERKNLISTMPQEVLACDDYQQLEHGKEKELSIPFPLLISVCVCV